jgi:RND family efflux transporter MFP subunit
MKYTLQTTRTVWLLAFGLSLLTAACSSKKEEQTTTAKSVQHVRLITLHSELRSEPVVASGQFTTEDEAILSFKAGGVIDALMVKEGDYVRQGQVLARLNLTEINTMLNQARLGLEKAQRDYQRVQNLYKDQVATQEQMQNSKTAVDLAQQQLEAAQFNVSYSEIRAVESGYVLRRFATAGQVVGPGTPVLQTNGSSQSEWLLKVSVSDQQWARLRAGDMATIETTARPGLELPAVVARKAEVANPMTGTFDVFLRVIRLPADFKLAAGLFGEARIQSRDKARVYAIPTESLLEGENLSGFIFLSYDRKTAHKQQVNITSMGKDSLYIEGNIAPESYLVTSGNAYLKDGDSIHPNN